MFKITDLKFTDNGKKISCDYHCSGETARFFNEKDTFYSAYDTDVSAVPKSIAAIPLLSNIAPIAWFAGFDIEIPEIDEDFLHSLSEIRKELTKHYPHIAGIRSEIKYQTLVKNETSGGKSAMLFSGGVDAFATFFRHYDETPALVTIHGADIEIADTKQWNDVVSFNENEAMLSPNRKHYIESNMRTFYTYHVDLLLENLSWWGNIQHGLALICSLAPLSYVYGYDKVYIASTRSVHMEFNPWGSMPEIDERISWSGINVIHDGFELKRQDKVDRIVKAVTDLNKKTTIRVCYSEIRQELNCSVCEKCIRTIFGIVLAGGNPNHLGFNTDASVYDKIDKIIRKGFKSKGTQFFWQEMYGKGKGAGEVFIFSDKDKEKAKIRELLSVIHENAGQELVKPSGMQKIKYVLINKYPRLFKFYMKLRRSI
ncbi:MAG TPA: hypothetical protein VGB50_09265 [Flavobacterium sp.]|jgi:hypothetical protein